MSTANSRDRLEQALSRIADPKGEGARACLTVYADAARAAADAADARARAGISLGPLDGKIVSIKDLFDVAGEVTRAGSRVLLEEGRRATADAPAVQRLRAAGAVIVAKTNMTEFAFSGVGANPHFGTPGNPTDRSRVPGGSTSGGAVAVGDGMSEIAIGSDTGGSTRIPAALCGIVGWKPSKQRVPTDGAFPLSFTLDSIGPMARTVADCANADAAMAGEAPWSIDPAPLAGLRLGIAQGMPFEGIDATVGAAWSDALGRLNRAGARTSDEALALFADMHEVNAKGGFSPAEAFSIHHGRLKARGDDIDPNVRFRIERGAGLAAADYVAMAQTRSRLVHAMDARLADLDALILPTTPIVAPTIAEVADREVFGQKNMLLLRNTAWINFFDLCAMSLPLPRSSGPGVGLMLVGRNGQDRRLLRIAAAVEMLDATQGVAGAACTEPAGTSTMPPNQPFPGRTPMPSTRTTTLDRRQLMAGAAATALIGAPAIVRAQGAALKVGLLLPKSGFQASIGQDCQRGADLAGPILKSLGYPDLQLMNADTETNVDVARTRAEKLIADGAQLLIGAFDSGQSSAIAQVAEQKGIPYVINIAAAPPITEQGYKFVFRNFPTAGMILGDAFANQKEIFEAVGDAPKTVVFLHVNDTFGMAMKGGIGAVMPKFNMPYQIVDQIAYDPAARDLSVELAKAKATGAEALMVVSRINDAILLTREMVKQRWSPKAILSMGPGWYEDQYLKTLGKLGDGPISFVPWYDPNKKLSKTLEAALTKAHPDINLNTNHVYTFEALLVAADAYKRAKSTDPKALADAIRTADITDNVSPGPGILFDAKGQNSKLKLSAIQNRGGKTPTVAPKGAANAKVEWPMKPYDKR